MARYDIYDGIISNGLTLSSGTSMYISSGGVANSTTVNSYGAMYISSGGVANSTTINGGYMFIYSGGIANSTTVNYRGSMFIYSGGTANSTTVNDLGWMFISSGGVANSTTVNDWGFMYISSGATANNTTLNSGGWMSISSGGTANSTTVNSGGWMSISSGGTATNVIWTPCVGLVSAADGAYVTYASKYSGVYFGSNDQLLSHTQSMSGKVVSGSMFVMSGGTANSTTVNSYGWMRISSGGTANSTTVNSGGDMRIYSGGVHRGSLQIESGATVGAYSGAIIDFTETDRKTEDGYLINNLSLIKGAPTYTVTVDDQLVSGTYKLAQGANSLTGTLTIGNGAVDYGSITVNGDDFAHNGKTYSLDQVDGNLTLTVDTLKTDGDLDGNGLADVILRHTKQGFTGAWLTTGDESIIKWGSLSDIKDDVRLLGTGKLYGTENDGQDIFFADGKSVGAWKVVKGKVTGYQYVMGVNSTTNVLGLGDFNGDGAADILLRSTSGDLGYFGTDGTGWHYLKGLGKEWSVAAVGDLNGNGTDDIIVRHDAGFTGAYMIDTNGKITWSNLDTLSNDMTIVGTGDFNGDGVDDVLLQNKSNGWVGAWLVEDGSVDGFMGICKNTNSIEQIADFNGDGIDDLRIRTDKGDIGVLYVKGADTTEWKYFQSVGSEWDTSFALIS